MGKPVSGRERFEGTLCRLLAEESPTWWAIRSGNNQGWDVHLFQHVCTSSSPWENVILFEVKSSVNRELPFYGRTYKQLKRYRRIYRENRIPTWYAYRWVTSRKKLNGKPLTNKGKWRFFHIRDIKKKLVWNDGLTWKEFMGRLK